MSNKRFWVERDGKAYCPFCPSRVRSWNPPYNETLTLIIDEEVKLTPEDWTMTGLDQLKTVCPECNIFLYDPNDEMEED